MNDSVLNWKNEVRHFGNYFNSRLNNNVDSKHKCSHFIGYFNTLISNFGDLQPDILSNLFKSYCCSFHGSFLWKYNSDGFIKCCTQWNKSIRKIFSLPYNTHRWLLGPLVKQCHIRYQLYLRDIKFVYRLLCCDNSIIQTCINNASKNANTLIGYKLSFFRSMFGINIFGNSLQYCLQQAKPINLSIEQQSHVHCIHTLFLSLTNHVNIEGLPQTEVNDILNFIVTG